MSAEVARQAAIAALAREQENLLRAAAAVPPDKHAWFSGGISRNTVEIVAHAAATNMFLASVIAGGPLPYRTQDEQRAAIDACTTLAQADAFLRQSVRAVGDAVTGIPPSRLTEQMTMPWGEKMPVALGLMTPAMHMAYHEGQISFIQALLGDDEYH